MIYKLDANSRSMTQRSLLFITLLFLFSCKSENTDVVDNEQQDNDTTHVEVIDEVDTSDVQSDYNVSDVPIEDRAEFVESLKKIEKEYGEQWDFCTCVVKNDSINKAFQEPNLPDAEFDRLFARSDYIEQKCQAFLRQNPNITPEERYKHEQKVKKCLKEAGIK